MKSKAPLRKAAVVMASAIALVITSASSALAAPPAALPANADAIEQTFQPAYDYDTDGCYQTPAIGPDGTIAEGLNTTGAINGNCRDQEDLDNTNGYARSLCNNGWCAVIYGSYFEKDQAVAGSGLGGHRHDWEHVVVWIQDNEARYVATSAHGNFDVYPSDQIRWDGTHPKVVYHKDGASTHCFRPANSNDEPPENHYHDWRFPALVGWEGYPDGLRDKLVDADFGSAVFGLKDGNFAAHLEKALPPDIPFDPNG
ncbi:NPP1 family protein [Streptomyces sp. NBC_01012]|uniref:NPP1 family protein n=1 Tax=Streptomyces sp. NBC_01012 TaxID=2903717 RepID=UPI00386DCE1A|nr:NPP1 family protein [Streptomyces sp. NBC_01012]